MEWIFEHKYLAAGIATFVVILVLAVIGIGRADPIGETVAQWSIQEAIFYGFCVLAFATFIK